MGAAQFHQRDRQGPAGVVGNDAQADGQESDTLRARVASELRTVERMQRIARPLALVVFALLALLAVLQLYTWIRVEQLTTLGQQREERATAAQAALREAIEKQQVALSQFLERAAPLGRPHPAANLAAAQAEDHAPAPPAHAQPKPGKAKAPPPAEPKAETSPVVEQVVPLPERTPPAGPAPSRGVSAVGQSSTTVYQNTSANLPNLSANHPETSAPPASQAIAAGQSAAASPNEQREDAPSVKPAQTDTVIARDHNDIERLRKLGKRDYVEFTLIRSGNRQEVAPDISLQLKKVDSKRLRCALSVYSEDYEFPTDLGINEPVVFPVRAMWDSVELVINKVGKDSVGGYLSARKGVLAAR